MDPGQHNGKELCNGIRFNFNNGQFGLSIGLHDDYFGVDDALNDNVAIDLAASVMIIPGLEARLMHTKIVIILQKCIDQLNAWIAFNPGDLTLALSMTYLIFTATICGIGLSQLSIC